MEKTRKNQIVYFVFFILIFVISMQSKKIGGDDVDFTRQILDEGRLGWLIKRYMTWSGRISSDFFASIFLTSKQIIWAITNSFFAMMLLYSINKLIFKEYNTKVMFSIATLGYVSLGILIDTTFWITGSFNYLWTIALGFFSLILVSNESEGVKTRYLYVYILCAVLSSFGVEQMSLCLLVFSFLANLKIYLKKRKINKTLFSYFVSVTLALMIVLLSPGNSTRIIVDSKKWYPEFLEMTFLDKISHGVIWQFNYWTKYLLAPNLLLAIVVLVSLIRMKSSDKITFIKVSIMVWLSCFIAINLLGLSNKIIFVNTELLNNYMFYIFWIIFYILIYGSAIYITQNKLATLFMILAMIFSASVLFFSPTIVASGARSLGVSFIFLILVVGKVVKNNQLLELKYSFLIYILPIINFVQLIYWLIVHGFSPHSFM